MGPALKPEKPISIYKKGVASADHANWLLFALKLVEVAGFEPAAPCSQSRCANRTAPHLELSKNVNPKVDFRGGEGGIRTRGTRD